MVVAHTFRYQNFFRSAGAVTEALSTDAVDLPDLHPLSESTLESAAPLQQSLSCADANGNLQLICHKI
jgi:hypothetical protein